MATKTTYVRARIEPELKKEVEGILAQIGLNTSHAINMFFQSVKRERGIPFELKIPNAETIEAMQELTDPEKRKNLKTYDNVDEMFAEWDKEDQETLNNA